MRNRRKPVILTESQHMKIMLRNFRMESDANHRRSCEVCKNPNIMRCKIRLGMKKSLKIPITKKGIRLSKRKLEQLKKEAEA